MGCGVWGSVQGTGLWVTGAPPGGRRRGTRTGLIYRWGCSLDGESSCDPGTQFLGGSDGETWGRDPSAGQLRSGLSVSFFRTKMHHDGKRSRDVSTGRGRNLPALDAGSGSHPGTPRWPCWRVGARRRNRRFWLEPSPSGRAGPSVRAAVPTSLGTSSSRSAVAGFCFGQRTCLLSAGPDSELV